MKKLYLPLSCALLLLTSCSESPTGTVAKKEAEKPPEPIAGLARIALARGDLEGAMTTIGEVLAHFDAGSSVDGTEDPIWIYLTCQQVLAAAASARAAEFLDRAHALLSERAAALGDDERGSFLANVPTHRAVVAAWTAAGRAAT